MSVALKQLFVTLLIATVWHAADAEYNVTAYCTMIKSGSQLPSTVSCSQYYVCGRAGAYDTRQCGNGFSFDKNKQSCQTTASVECYYGLENPCLGKTETHVPDTSKCGGWLYCKDGQQKGSGTCPNGQVLINSACDYGKCSNDPTETEQTPIPICDIMPVGKWFGSTSDCETYLRCLAGKAEPETGSCSDGTVFDCQRETCNYKSATDCSRITGEEVPGSEGKETCDSGDLNAKKPNKNVCSSYGTCDGTKWVYKSCPPGEYYDEAGAKCMARKIATPVKTCNRCEGTNVQFVNGVDPNCETYQVCSGGAKTGESKCKEGYFDEESGACVVNATPAQTDKYKETHGACKGTGGPSSCSADCAKLSGAACIPGGGCSCALNDDDKCIDCGTGGITDGKCVPCACTADADAKCTDTVTTTCNCGYKDQTNCAECTATSVCLACVCKDNSSDECVNVGTGGTCECGRDAGSACIECPNGVELSGECTVV